MSKRVVNVAGSAPPLAPYSPGTLAGNTLYVSGMLPMDEQGNSVGVGDVRTQTYAVMDAIKAVVDSAGAQMTDIAYSMIFLKNLDDYAEFNSIYAEYFPTEPPARFCIRADLVRPEFLVEVACIAHLS